MAECPGWDKEIRTMKIDYEKLVEQVKIIKDMVNGHPDLDHHTEGLQAMEDKLEEKVKRTRSVDVVNESYVKGLEKRVDELEANFKEFIQISKHNGNGFAVNRTYNKVKGDE